MPQVLEEIVGIAEGSGLGYEQILQLNLCEEIWNKTVGWCSAICLVDGPDGPLLGKTGDVGEGDEQFHLMQWVDGGGTYRILRGTFVGTLWTAAGINEAGLAFAVSAVKPKTLGQQGLPGLALVQACLEGCATVRDATTLLASFHTIGTARNFMFADASGDVAVVEKCPTGQARRVPHNGAIVQTNHFIADGMEDLVVEDREWLENSYARYEVLNGATREMTQTRPALQALLGYHSDRGAICQHGGAGGRFHTMAAYVLVPRLREMWMTPGPPCKNESIQFRVVEDVGSTLCPD